MTSKKTKRRSSSLSEGQISIKPAYNFLGFKPGSQEKCPACARRQPPYKINDSARELSDQQQLSPHIGRIKYNKDFVFNNLCLCCRSDEEAPWEIIDVSLLQADYQKLYEFVKEISTGLELVKKLFRHEYNRKHKAVRRGRHRIRTDPAIQALDAIHEPDDFNFVHGFDLIRAKIPETAMALIKLGIEIGRCSATPQTKEGQDNEAALHAEIEKGVAADLARAFPKIGYTIWDNPWATLPSREENSEAADPPRTTTKKKRKATNTPLAD